MVISGLIDTIIIAGIVVVAPTIGISEEDVARKIDERTKRKCQCPEDTKKRLQDEVNRQCKSGERRCTGAQDLATLQANRARNAACLYARQMINVQCFDGGDEVHTRAVGQALNSVRKCDDLIERFLRQNDRRIFR
jgi:Novel toxin 16